MVLANLSYKTQDNTIPQDAIFITTKHKTTGHKVHKSQDTRHRKRTTRLKTTRPHDYKTKKF